ncbi:MAG: Transcriptional activator protein NhaR [Planctomycetota bacterium]|jgi:LysR family transcriptional activator of nhaA
MWLNYHHLFYFYTAAREGSLAAASKELHLSTATLSIQIRELEKSLGAKLFEKKGRGLALTESGEIVQRYAQDIFALGEEMVEYIHGNPIGRPLELRVGLRDAMAKLVAYKLLRPAMKAEQECRLVCHEGEMNRLIADLSVHKLDVVLTDRPLDPSLGVKAYSHLLWESEVHVVGTKELAERYSGDFPFSLNQSPFVLPTEDTVLRRQVDKWFGDRGIRVEVRGEFADSAMLEVAGRAGDGLMVVPGVVVKDLRDLYGMVTLGKISGVRENFYAISLERKLKHPGVLAIVEGAKKGY